MKKKLMALVAAAFAMTIGVWGGTSLAMKGPLHAPATAPLKTRVVNVRLDSTPAAKTSVAEKADTENESSGVETEDGHDD